MAHEPNDSAVELALRAQVDRFDYGVLARRLDRTSSLRGQVSADLALIGSGPTLESILRNATGRIDFAAWPIELSGRAFNLWSASLLMQLLPLVQADPRASINCIVGRFDLLGGILSEDKLLIDTTAVRVRGAGTANLETEQLQFVFRPRAKGLAFFRLQTPLRVSGTFSDQRFGFSRLDVPSSVLRLIASPVLVPLEQFTLGPQPRDGADVCTDPLRSGAD
jgi:AsmA family protein